MASIQQTSRPNSLDPAQHETNLRRTSEVHPKEDLVEYLNCYARQHPGHAALFCLGVGFALGWKLKPW